MRSTARHGEQQDREVFAVVKSRGAMPLSISSSRQPASRQRAVEASVGDLDLRRMPWHQRRKEFRGFSEALQMVPTDGYCWRWH